MISSYISPGKGHGRPPAVNPVPKEYHHLESDRALLNATKSRTSRSEASDQYGTPIEDPAECVAKRRETLRERTARISDNKQSHIHLGFDKPKQSTEKVGNEKIMNVVYSHTILWSVHSCVHPACIHE